MRTFDPHEHIRLGHLKGKPLAPFWRRALAFVIDFVLAFFLFAGTLIYASKLIAYLGLIDSNARVNLKFNFTNWYSILFIVLYFGLLTYFGRGRTPGKRLVSIRVVSLVHERLSFWHSLERALGYGASALELGFGFFQYFIHPNRRTVHDRIAETIVILDTQRMKKKGEKKEEAAEEA